MCREQAGTPPGGRYSRSVCLWPYSWSHSPADRHLATLAARPQPPPHAYPGPEPLQHILSQPGCPHPGPVLPRARYSTAHAGFVPISISSLSKPPRGRRALWEHPPAAGVPLLPSALGFSDAAPAQTSDSLPEGFMPLSHSQDLPSDCHPVTVTHPAGFYSSRVTCNIFLPRFATNSPLTKPLTLGTAHQVPNLALPDILTATPPPRHAQGGHPKFFHQHALRGYHKGEKIPPGRTSKSFPSAQHQNFWVI